MPIVHHYLVRVRYLVRYWWSWMAVAPGISRATMKFWTLHNVLLALKKLHFNLSTIITRNIKCIPLSTKLIHVHANTYLVHPMNIWCAWYHSVTKCNNISKKWPHYFDIFRQVPQGNLYSTYPVSSSWLVYLWGF